MITKRLIRIQKSLGNSRSEVDSIWYLLLYFVQKLTTQKLTYATDHCCYCVDWNLSPLVCNSNHEAESFVGRSLIVYSGHVDLWLLPVLSGNESLEVFCNDILVTQLNEK